VYRADLVIDYKAIDALKRFVQQYPTLVAKEVRARFYGEIAQPMLEDFKHYPGPAKHPFEWSSNPTANARARGWFFANYPQGYRRTGKLAQGYTIGVTENDDALAIFVRNPSKALKWVKGKRQIPGHKRSGWRLDSDLYSYWRDRVREMTIKVVRQIVPKL
jgi:hypothetical protein